MPAYLLLEHCARRLPFAEARDLALPHLAEELVSSRLHLFGGCDDGQHRLLTLAIVFPCDILNLQICSSLAMDYR